MPRGTATIDTPVGTLQVSVAPDGAVRVDWAGARADGHDRLRVQRPACRAAHPVHAGTRTSAQVDAAASAALAASITRWLQGDSVALRSAPIPRGTPWQVACWRAARRIPYGQTRTYLWLAREACRDLCRPASDVPALARAAGQAMRRNPAPIVVPCHRVVSASGLGGYAGTDEPKSRSLARKRWLLGTEAQRIRDPLDLAPRRAAGYRRS